MNGARPCGSTKLQDASTCTCSYYCHTINEAFLKEVHIQHHPFESTPDGPAFLFEEKQSRSSLHLLIQTIWDGVVVGEPKDLGVFLHERVYLVGVFQSIHHHKQHCVVVD